MSIQHIKNKAKRQALRLRPVYEPLKFWLDLIKDIPGWQELPEWNVPESGKVTEETLKSWYETLSVLPKNVELFVRGDPASSFERYQYVKGILDIVRRIVRHRLALAKGAMLNVGDIIPVGLGYLRINPANQIDFVKSPLVEALQGVDADRIRECGNKDCKRIFWAGRRDQPCCSKKCANVRRVQKWRDRYQDTYKQNRLNSEVKPILKVKAAKENGKKGR